MTNKDANQMMNRRLRVAARYAGPSDDEPDDGDEATRSKTEMNAIGRDQASRRRIVTAGG